MTGGSAGIYGIDRAKHSTYERVGVPSENFGGGGRLAGGCVCAYAGACAGVLVVRCNLT